MAKKVIIIGLDGCNPDLVYKWIDELPNFKRLMDKGIHGHMESTIPAITPQAWTAVLSSRNPGAFGFWDFSYRDDFSYGEPKLVNSGKSRSSVKTLDMIMPEHGKVAALINVPVTYPPVQIKNGYCISDFMTPSVTDHDFTWPVELKSEVEELVGEYILDASTSETNFRKMDRESVKERIYKMDEQRFTLLKHFINTKNCDFIFTVIMGTDRMPHLFYRYMDESHVRYTPDEKWKDALKDHYKFCDKNIGEIIDTVDDETSIIVMSDHSVQALDNRLNINDWLIQEGYLKLRSMPESPTPLKKCDVDWENTMAYGTGYTGQIFLNVKGREAQGCIDPADHDRVLEELAQKIIAVTGPNGEKLDTKVFKAKEVYKGQYAKYAPDLFLYLDNLAWNVSEPVGHSSIYSYDTGLGEDDGGHGRYAIFAMAGPGVPARGKLEGLSLYDVAPTVLEAMELSIPDEMEGRSLISDKAAYTEEDEEEVRKRLAALGYLS